MSGNGCLPFFFFLRRKKFLFSVKLSSYQGEWNKRDAREEKRLNGTAHWEMGRKAETLILWFKNGI